MFCSKCGAAIASDADFCQRCGTPIARAAAAAPPPGFVSPHSGAGAIPYAIGVVYAGFWLRFAAYLIDRILVGAATMILVIPFFFLVGGASILDNVLRHRDDHFAPERFWPFLPVILTLAGVAVVIQWLYFAYLESGEKQATWGKQLLGLYVTDLQGHRLTFGRASGRYFAKIITGLIPLGIGFIMAGFTERRQALHDMIASTLVLRR